MDLTISVSCLLVKLNMSDTKFCKGIINWLDRPDYIFLMLIKLELNFKNSCMILLTYFETDRRDWEDQTFELANQTVKMQTLTYAAETDRKYWGDIILNLQIILWLILWLIIESEWHDVPGRCTPAPFPHNMRFVSMSMCHQN